VRIARISATTVTLPARRLHPMAFGGERLGRYVIVEVETDDGLVGLGEATVLPQWGGDHGRYYGETPQTTVEVVEHVLAPVLVGEDPRELERAHETMNRALKGYPYAKAAIDVALHDVTGKAYGVPVYQLLGGLARRSVPVAHSLGILDLETMRSEAAAAVEDGIRTIKVKVGLDPERDVAAVGAVREVVGDDVEIVVDANQGYPTAKVAIRTLRRLEEQGIRYVEQPVEGLRQLAQVASAIDTPVMADESAWNAYDVLEIARTGAADLISLYTTKPGGLNPAKKAAAVAEAAGLPCNVNGSAETGVGNAANLHLAASTRCVSEACVIPITTVAGRAQTAVAGIFYTDDLLADPFRFEDGCLVVPDGPGLGIELDREKLEHYRVA
jgi:muconate cycloisomerase